ncbi:MAG TPA: hypothetical protein VGA76_08095 [Candidatus Dormibacteraeota bacterium]
MLGWVDRFTRSLSWPIIVPLLAAGGVNVLVGLGCWFLASSTTSLSIQGIQVYSGTVVSVSSDPKVGTYVMLDGPGDRSLDFFFDSPDYPNLPDVRVGDQVTIWAEHYVGFEAAIKLQSSRGTWVATIRGEDLNPTTPLPAYGPLVILGLGLGGLMTATAALGIVRRRPLGAGADHRVPTTASPSGLGHATAVAASWGGRTSTALGALAAGADLWVAAWTVQHVVGCAFLGLAYLMWLATLCLYVVAAVLSGRRKPVVTKVAVLLAVAAFIWLPVSVVAIGTLCGGG